MVRRGSEEGVPIQKRQINRIKNSPAIVLSMRLIGRSPHQSRARRYWDNVGSQHLAVLVPRLKLRFKKRIQLSHRNIKATHVRSSCAAASGQSVTAAP